MACGKSFVAGALGRLGCHVIEADDVGHEVMEPGGEAYDAVLAAFGTDRSDRGCAELGVLGIRNSSRS